MRGRPVTCCFTGHRPNKLPWGNNEEDRRCLALKKAIADAVEAAYLEGFRHFICGMAMGCDLYFAEAVLALRAAGNPLTLEAAIPFPGQAAAWPPDQQSRYRDILAQCDYETVVQERYTPYCMIRRNRYMVDHSALVIAAYNGEAGGTRQTLEYAIRQSVPFVDIRPEA